MRKKQHIKLKLGSVLSGVGLGVLVGFWVNLIYSFNYSLYVYVGGGILLFGLMAWKQPKSTEILAYALSIFVFLQMVWDYAVGDRGEIRLSLFLSAVVLLLVNMFSGYYKLKTPIKIFKKAIGVG